MAYTLDDYLDDMMDYTDEWLDDTLYSTLDIQVRCTKCKKVQPRKIFDDQMCYYSDNGDGTYTEYAEICDECNWPNGEKAQIAAEQLRQALEQRNAEHAAQLSTEQREISDGFTRRMTAIIQEQLERTDSDGL